MENSVQLRSRFDNGDFPCPECGTEGPHDDNGCAGIVDKEFCCNGCGVHVDGESAWDVLCTLRQYTVPVCVICHKSMATSECGDELPEERCHDACVGVAS